MAGRVQRNEVPAGQRHRRAILEQDIGLGSSHELANAHGCAGELGPRLIGHAGIDEQRVHAREQALEAEAVSRGNERGIGGMERDPRAGRLAQPAGEPVVVQGGCG